MQTNSVRMRSGTICFLFYNEQEKSVDGLFQIIVMEFSSYKGY